MKVLRQGRRTGTGHHPGQADSRLGAVDERPPGPLASRRGRSPTSRRCRTSSAWINAYTVSRSSARLVPHVGHIDPPLEHCFRLARRPHAQRSCVIPVSSAAGSGAQPARQADPPTEGCRPATSRPGRRQSQDRGPAWLSRDNRTGTSLPAIQMCGARALCQGGPGSHTSGTRAFPRSVTRPPAKQGRAPGLVTGTQPCAVRKNQRRRSGRSDDATNLIAYCPHTENQHSPRVVCLGPGPWGPAPGRNRFGAQEARWHGSQSRREPGRSTTQSSKLPQSCSPSRASPRRPSTLGRVPLLVVVLVELRRPPATRSTLEAVADPVRWNRDGGFDPTSAQVGAVAAGVVRLVGPHPVRALARTAEPSLGTRMASRTASNCGESPRCPAVITTDKGFCPCSTARWILLVSPPRERPRPWSAGSMKIPPGGSFWRSPFSLPRRRAGGPGRRWSRR
jgi:hypothetical protein